jgi:Ca-activated chloride channel family protein
MQMPVTGGRKNARGQPETRMDAVKRTVIDFIRHRKGDRIGVIVFSNNAYVVSPMTLDYPYLIHYVEMINEQTLSDEGMTSIGEGLLLARDLILRQEVESDKRGNVIVLLTDGENNTGRPVDYALSEVKKASMKIYFIGVEVTMGTTVQNQGFNEAPSLLSGVRATGGRYFDARDATQLEKDYDEVNVLEKGKFQTRTQLHDVPAFAPFAWVALAALAAGFLMGTIPRFRELS